MSNSISVRLSHSLNAIIEACGNPRLSPLKRSGGALHLMPPRPNWLETSGVTDALSSEARSKVYEIVTVQVEAHYGKVVQAFERTMEQLMSVDNSAIDVDTEDCVRQFYTARFHQFLDRIITTLSDRFDQASAATICRRAGGFDSRSVSVLEAAFSRSQSLTARECTLVAEAAGISHQQVRTWNKRNRGNRYRRTGSTSELPVDKRVVEPTVTEQRVISALPRRSQQKSYADTDAGQDRPATRAVRGLPKRKPAPTVESPAKSETSSLDSIPSSGGFLSPLNATTSNPPIIAFPDDHNAFSQTANPWMLGDGLLESPMNMGGMMPWDAAFNFDLGNFEQSIQAVLDDPTLSGSPALSYGASTDTEGNPIGTPEDEYLKLGLSELDGDELLQMLNNAEYIPSMEEMLVDCAAAEGDLAASADWSQMGGSSAEMQMEETVVTVEEVGSSWSGSSGRNTPSLVESLPAGQAAPDINAPAIDNTASAASATPVYERPSGSQAQQHATLAPSVIVTRPTPSPGADHSQSAFPHLTQHHHIQYAQLPATASQPISIDHVHPSYPYSVPAQPGQVQHIYYAAPPPHVYYAVPFPPQPYPPTQHESTCIAGVLPFDNVYAQQPVQVVYGAPPHGVEFPMDIYEQHPAQEQAMADGGVWT